MKMRNCGQKLFLVFVLSFFVGMFTLSANQDNSSLGNDGKKPSTKADASSWKELGPSNVGGRIKAILWSKKDANILYAGSPSGGLYISTNQGKDWTKAEGEIGEKPISCIYQTNDGTIYVGTGEKLFGYGIADSSFTNKHTSHCIGNGIYKSTDGKTFEHLSATSVSNQFNPNETWAYVNQLAYNETNHTLYAATNNGLFFSTDNGTTWVTTASPITGTCTDVKISKTGTIYFTNIDRFTYASVEYRSLFVKSTENSNLTDSKIIFTPQDTVYTSGDYFNFKAIQIALTDLDDSYIYLNVAGVKITGNPQAGVFLSNTKGTEWTRLTDRDLNFFNTPSQNYAGYSGAVTVLPDNKKSVLAGGYGFYSGQSQIEGGEYIWGSAYGSTNILAYKNTTAYASLYLHENIHSISYSPSDNAAFAVATDGGVYLYHYRDVDRIYGYEPMNKGLNVTQFYSVAVDNDGAVIGGTQGNHVVYTQTSGIDADINSSTYGKRIDVNKEKYADIIYWNGTSNNGGSAAASIFQRSTPTDRSPIFVSQFNTDLARVSSSYYDAENLDRTLIAGTNMFGVGKQSPTTGLLWESTTAVSIPKTINADLVDDMKIRKADGSSYYLNHNNNKVIEPGDTVMLRDKTKQDYPFDYVFQNYIYFHKDTLITVQSPIQSRYFLISLDGDETRNDSIAMCDEILDYTASTLNKRWVSVFSPDYYGNSKQIDRPSCLAISKDGDVLFVGTRILEGGANADKEKSRLYKVSGLTNVAVHYDTIRAKDGNDSVITPISIKKRLARTLISSFDREITSISVDPNNANNVLLTFGNTPKITDSSQVILVTNALTTPRLQNKNSGLTNFGNPIYSGLITMNDSNIAYVGTEKGVYKTTNLMDNSCVWDPISTGEEVPVYLVIQQQNNLPTTIVSYPKNNQLYTFKATYKPGAIYFATHGRGIFIDETYIVPSKDTVKVGIDEINERSYTKGQFEMSLYPNPIESVSTLVYTLPTSSNIIIKAYSIDGQIVYQKNLGYKKADTYTEIINANNLRKGVVVIQLITDKGSQTIKAIVK